MKKVKPTKHHFTAITADDDWETRLYAADGDGCETCHGRGWVRLRLPQPLYAIGTKTRINCPTCGGGHSTGRVNPN